MIRVRSQLSQLGRLGEDFYTPPTDFVSAPTPEADVNWSPYPEPAAATEDESLLSSSTVSEKAVVSNQTTAKDVATTVFGVADKALAVAKTVVNGERQVAPAGGVPISAGPKPATMALVALGAMALLGVGYVALAD